jgi:hypothetical protein
MRTCRTISGYGRVLALSPWLLRITATGARRADPQHGGSDVLDAAEQNATLYLRTGSISNPADRDDESSRSPKVAQAGLSLRMPAALSMTKVTTSFLPLAYLETCPAAA